MSHAEDIDRIHRAAFGIRDMPAPPRVLPLLKQANLRVPTVGETYEPRSLDEALSAGKLSTDERFFLKDWLRSQGLLARK
jgi:hypothetical protein